MEQKLPIYKGILSDINFDAINGMSVVGDPAMQEDFIFLSLQGDREKFELAVATTEKRLITGPALIPDKLVLRQDRKRGKFYLKFDVETVEQASQMFLKEFKQTNISLEHLLNVKNVTIVESWLVEDAENDKANSLGFNVPKGTWMVSMKVDNDRVWKGVKDGMFNGFSIEALFTLVLMEDEVESESAKLMSGIKEILNDITF